jgi:hypothetical protein
MSSLIASAISTKARVNIGKTQKRIRPEDDH